MNFIISSIAPEYIKELKKSCKASFCFSDWENKWEINNCKLEEISIAKNESKPVSKRMRNWKHSLKTRNKASTIEKIKGRKMKQTKVNTAIETNMTKE